MRRTEFERMLAQRMRETDVMEFDFRVLEEAYPEPHHMEGIRLFAESLHNKQQGRANTSPEPIKRPMEQFEEFVKAQGWEIYPTPHLWRRIRICRSKGGGKTP